MSIAPSDQSNRLLAALAYPIWLVALVIVVSDLKRDPFMRHHGWTALFWGIGWLALWVAATILSGIPFLGFLVGILTFPILWLAWLILSVYYAVQTYEGKSFTIPLVSDWAKKYAT
ncbi:MAG: DUF4870 domain-containing protein [Armatimonadota bacterium]|nr:DUF4870 domain-containing protein [Armatimonadota bacterium]MDR7532009.1 DUF4870 domain-containing protein [Armatimonadota bacterium]MDR7535940.1 DUF4870 domain-containing protein [Armatimonadota bacterium]